MINIRDDYRNKLLRKIRTYCKVNYSRLSVSDDMVMGDMPYNFRCHLNAVQKVKRGEAEEVYVCIACDKDCDNPVVHFINRLENGKYQDNTWGWLYEQSEYYIIRKVEEHEYDDIWNLLVNTKKVIVEANSNSIVNKLLRVDSSLI